MNKVKKFLYSQKAAPYVFILPFVLTVILFWVFPIANGVLLSFQDVLKDKWVGMNNYKRLLSDTYFRKAVWNSFKYMVGTLVLLIPFPMLFASMLNSKLMKAKGFFKSVYFIPALTSVVVVGTIFRLMFGEMDTALANQILNFFGHSSIKWLKGEWTGYFALLLVACWRWTGVNILLDCQHFFRQIFLGYFSDIVQAFDTLRKNVCGDDYTSLHNPIVLSSVLPAYGMFHSIQILFL